MKEGRRGGGGLGGWFGEGGGGFVRGGFGGIYGFGHGDGYGEGVREENAARKEGGLSESFGGHSGECGWVRCLCMLTRLLVSIPFRNITPVYGPRPHAKQTVAQTKKKMPAGIREIPEEQMRRLAVIRTSAALPRHNGPITVNGRCVFFFGEIPDAVN